VWHASVQAPGTGERHVFADLEELFAFMEEQTRSALAAPDDTCA
jgi:hypothetical protein